MRFTDPAGDTHDIRPTSESYFGESFVAMSGPLRIRNLTPGSHKSKVIAGLTEEEIEALKEHQRK